MICLIEKQRLGDYLSLSVERAPRIPDADVRRIRNLGFPESDRVMDEKAYSHSPHQPAQGHTFPAVLGIPGASCVGTLPVGRYLAFTRVCFGLFTEGGHNSLCHTALPAVFSLPFCRHRESQPRASVSSFACLVFEGLL